MPLIHCVGGSRTCGAVTVAKGNTTVYVGDRLWAVEGDPNNHGGGELIASGATTLSINDRRVIVKGDPARPDGARHSNPAAADGVATASAGA